MSSIRRDSWGGLAAAATLGVLGVPAAARADHPADYAGGLWPLASLLVLALAFALMWAVSAALERRQDQRPADKGPGSGRKAT